MSTLQHPLRGRAPAACSGSGRPMGGADGEDMVSGLCGTLGAVPHSIRGFLSQFQQVLPATLRFNQCVACSEKVLKEYSERGQEFLLQVFDTPGYLEDLTGLTELQQVADTLEVLELSDAESETME